MFDGDEIEKLTKNATEAIDAWREGAEGDEKLLDDADYALTMLRMAIGEEAFSNAHWFYSAHRRIIKQLDGQKSQLVDGKPLGLSVHDARSSQNAAS